jgi:hypothetical protein
MDYKKHYDLLITTRKNRKIIDGDYYERHHIIPKSMGGTNELSNLIYLTAREHFIAHWLLWRIYENKEMAFAFYAITHMGKNHTITSSRVYEESKLARRQFIIENNKKYHKGKKLSEQQIEKIRETSKNLIRTEQHRENISKSLKNKPKTNQHKENISKSLKNYDWSNYHIRNSKISESNKGKNNGRSKIVHMVGINEEILKIFETMDEALKYVKDNVDSKMSKTTFWRRCEKKTMFNDFYFLFG